MPAPIQKFVFDQVIADAVKSGKGALTTQESINWFRLKIKNYGITKANLLSESAKAKRSRQEVLPGQMFFYAYDPKLKDELPFYDAFPLIFVVDVLPDGFTGLNLHYLPPNFRMALMRQLFEYVSNKNLPPQAKLKLSYKKLKAASGLPLFKPCFKRYLFGHVRSPYISVIPAEWTSALFLPVADFKKKSQRYVWDWSKSEIK